MGRSIHEPPSPHRHSGDHVLVDDHPSSRVLSRTEVPSSSLAAAPSPVLVILLCGPAGSGKSHLAARLERRGLERLSIDELAWDRGMHHHPLTPEQSALLDALLKDRLLDSVRRGSDVVVDSSFWSRRTREEYRSLPYPRPVRVETWYLRAPEHLLRARVAERTNTGPHDIVLTQEVLTGFLAGFEKPTSDEGTLRIIDDGRLPPDLEGPTTSAAPPPPE